MIYFLGVSILTVNRGRMTGIELNTFQEKNKNKLNIIGSKN